MKSSVGALLIALAIAALVTPVVRRLAMQLGAVDAPGGRRVHAGEIPRLGGIALIVAFFGALVSLFLLDSSLAGLFFQEPKRVIGLVVGGVMVATLGVADDLRGVRAWHKLAVQAMAATVVFYAGFRIEAISLPGLRTMQMGVFALPVTVLWIATVVNALNLIDGLDGLAAGIAFFAALTNFIVSLIHHDLMVMLLSAALAGAVLGFLLYNFNPATIFMGDSGSMFLGFVLATSALLGHSVKSSTSVAILAPLIALGVPIMDTLLAIVRRYLERRPIFSADRGHIHHRLLDLGLTHRRAVLSLYGLSMLFCAVAIVVALGSSWEIGSALIFCLVAMVGMVRVGGYMRRRSRSSTDRLAGSILRASTALLGRAVVDGDAKRMRRALDEFGRASGLTALELSSDGSDEKPVHHWATMPAAVGPQATVCCAAVADAEGEFRLKFTGSLGSLGVEEEAALMLVTRALASLDVLAGLVAGARAEDPSNASLPEEQGTAQEPGATALEPRVRARHASVP